MLDRKLSLLNGQTISLSLFTDCAQLPATGKALYKAVKDISLNKEITDVHLQECDSSVLLLQIN